MGRSLQSWMTTGYLTPESRRAILHRLSRAEGQVRAVRRALTRGACVDDLLLQISAARAALTRVAILLAEDHLADCAQRCMPGTRDQVLRRIVRALSAVIRNS